LTHLARAKRLKSGAPTRAVELLAWSRMEQANSPRPLVLICDDEPQIVSILGRQAKRLGLQFIGDTSAEHVCELARQHRPAVIILDIMQNIDGRDILAALKKDPATRDLKVIMLTAIEDQYTRQVCIELGADDYALKPFDLTFMSKVARLVRETCGTLGGGPEESCA
jgi:CheY-like chemotaxis protein